MISCGNCKKQHPSVADVRACYNNKIEEPKPAPKLPEVPEWAKDPASERQISYLTSLADRKDDSGITDEVVHEVIMDCLAGKTIGKAEASRAIDALAKCPDAKKDQSTDRWPYVPEGRYALPASDGHTAFYKVDKPTEGKWAGNVYVKQLIGAPGSWREERVRDWAKVMDRIDNYGARESAILYGRKLRHCGRCDSPLSNLRSRAAGYGETCSERMGWPYPTLRDARRILAEMGEDVDQLEMELAHA